MFAKEFLETLKSKKWFKIFENSDIKNNKENDLDFLLETNRGDMYLELMEIAPLDFFKTDYKSAPNQYKDYDFGKYIFNKINNKSKKYSSIKDKPICLLIYVTDWKFILSDTTIALLQYWLISNQHGFQYVFYFSYSGENMKTLYTLYPTDIKFFKNFDESKYKENTTYLFDPNKVKFKFSLD